MCTNRAAAPGADHELGSGSLGARPSAGPDRPRSPSPRSERAVKLASGDYGQTDAIRHFFMPANMTATAQHFAGTDEPAQSASLWQ